MREYLRPQVVRDNWTNLNGLWNYVIVSNDAVARNQYDGKNLVPYPVESALSGVKKSLGPDQCTWYKRKFDYTKGKTILHFGAVHYKATVYINGVEAGSHEGGYTEFSYDITRLLKKGSNEITVKVWD